MNTLHGSRFRAYSLKLFLISIPVSYIGFMIVFWGVGVLPHGTPGGPSLTAGFVVVSWWYALSCYVWIPLTWLVGSLAIAIIRRHSP